MAESSAERRGARLDSVRSSPFPSRPGELGVLFFAGLMACVLSLTACTSAEVGNETGTSPCVYPQSPYGLNVGERLNPQLVWEGYWALEPDASVIEAASYLDCDSSAGVSAVQLVQVISDCMTCQRQVLELADTLPTDWQNRGIRILVLVARDSTGAPATLATARDWLDNFGAGVVDVAVDPNFTFAVASANGMPVQIIVDPRKMQILGIESGYFGDYSLLDSVARANGE